MEKLIVFDNKFDAAKLIARDKDSPITLHLFTFTSNFILIEEVKHTITQYPQLTIVDVNTAQLINNEVEAMQKNVHTWSHLLSQTEIDGRTLKEWFLYPDQNATSWWLGLIAEKNTVQDNVFLSIAQLNALEKYIAQHPELTECYLAIKDKKKRQILRTMIKKLNMVLTMLPTESSLKLSLKNKIIAQINQNAWCSALLNLCLWIKDSTRARLQLKKFAARLEDARKRQLLFITYFPNIDEEKAAQGIFVNKYVERLQTELAQAQVSITWLAMPVFYNGHRFSASIKFAKQFIDHGESFFLLQEFFTLRIALKSFYWWLKQSIKSVRLRRKIPVQKLTGLLASEHAIPYLDYIWRHSFIGTSSMRGIIFYLAYSHFFRKLKLETCLYFCEMQAWEKALNLAKKKYSPETKTYAFQHTVIMRNFFNYFYSPADHLPQHKNTDFPLPDTLIANGSNPRALFEQYQYPNLKEAEAIRQLYFNQTLQHHEAQLGAAASRAKPVLLVVGSYDRQETRALFTLLYGAFPYATDFEIWIKASPVNPAEPLFRELNINITDTCYHICNDNVATLLPNATVVFVANTTVAIEAAAFNCEVIIPLLADTMMMNPIIETTAQYHMISNPVEFKSLVLDKIRQRRRNTINHSLIAECWHIDPTLSLWKGIFRDAKVT